MAFVHQTVLGEETVELLLPEAGKLIVDGTLGGGGHAERFLHAGAQVIGLDVDPRALKAASERLEQQAGFTAVLSNYADVEAVLEARNIGEVDGFLLDLGVSSPQLDEGERGFSFSQEGPLDMRMGNSGPTVAELLSQSDEALVAQVLWDYGEEPFSRAIARALKANLPLTTQEAVRCVERAVPRKAWPKRIHVATRTFQALRIWVNGELANLDRFLKGFPKLLKVGGRAAIISFHSLEDRRVKGAFRDLEGRCTCPPRLPICVCGAQGAFKLLTRKAVQASLNEQESNPRARSARLRAVEKIR